MNAGTGDLWLTGSGRVKHRDRYGRENEWEQDEARMLWAALGDLLGLAPPPRRVLVQIAGAESRVLGVDNHGDGYRLLAGMRTWERLPDLPQDSPPGDKAGEAIAAVNQFIATAERAEATGSVLPPRPGINAGDRLPRLADLDKPA